MHFQTLLQFLVATVVCVKYIESCTTNEDCQSESWGKYSLCENGECKCSDFFIIHPIVDECIKVSSYNKPCEYDEQCQGFLGNDAACRLSPGSPPGPGSSKICECSSIPFPDDVFHYEGKCYVRKNLGAPCTQDIQCTNTGMNGTNNALARCTDNICSCLVDVEMGIEFVDMDGMCMLKEVECDPLDMSLFAVMIAGSVALILIIYVIYRIGRRVKK